MRSSSTVDSNIEESLHEAGELIASSKQILAQIAQIPNKSERKAAIETAFSQASEKLAKRAQELHGHIEHLKEDQQQLKESITRTTREMESIRDQMTKTLQELETPVNADTATPQPQRKVYENRRPVPPIPQQPNLDLPPVTHQADLSGDLPPPPPNLEGEPAQSTIQVPEEDDDDDLLEEPSSSSSSNADQTTQQQPGLKKTPDPAPQPRIELIDDNDDIPSQPQKNQASAGTSPKSGSGKQPQVPPLNLTGHDNSWSDTEDEEDSPLLRKSTGKRKDSPPPPIASGTPQPTPKKTKTSDTDAKKQPAATTTDDDEAEELLAKTTPLPKSSTNTPAKNKAVHQQLAYYARDAETLKNEADRIKNTIENTPERAAKLNNYRKNLLHLLEQYQVALNNNPDSFLGKAFFTSSRNEELAAKRKLVNEAINNLKYAEQYINALQDNQGRRYYSSSTRKAMPITDANNAEVQAAMQAHFSRAPVPGVDPKISGGLTANTQVTPEGTIKRYIPNEISVGRLVKQPLPLNIVEEINPGVSSVQTINTDFSAFSKGSQKDYWILAQQMIQTALSSAPAPITVSEGWPKGTEDYIKAVLAVCKHMGVECKAPYKYRGNENEDAAAYARFIQGNAELAKNKSAAAKAGFESRMESIPQAPTNLKPHK